MTMVTMMVKSVMVTREGVEMAMVVFSLCRLWVLWVLDVSVLGRQGKG